MTDSHSKQGIRKGAGHEATRQISLFWWGIASVAGATFWISIAVAIL